MRPCDLPSRLNNINEYSTYAEEDPAGSAWRISPLERIDAHAHGLRDNRLASLRGKDDSDSVYYRKGDYQVYQYYGTIRT